MDLAVGVAYGLVQVRSPAPPLIALVGLILRRRQVEQLTRSRDVLDAPAVGERTVVADAVETLRLGRG